MRLGRARRAPATGRVALPRAAGAPRRRGPPRRRLRRPAPSPRRGDRGPTGRGGTCDRGRVVVPARCPAGRRRRGRRRGRRARRCWSATAPTGAAEELVAAIDVRRAPRARTVRARRHGPAARRPSRRRPRRRRAAGVARRSRPRASAGLTRWAGRCWRAPSRSATSRVVARPRAVVWSPRTIASIGRSSRPSSRGCVASSRSDDPPVSTDARRGDPAPTTATLRWCEVLPPDPATMDLAEAPRIVAGGGRARRRRSRSPRAGRRRRGARRLRIGASRVAADAGWAAHDRFIGTTGVAVDPDALHRVRHLRRGAARVRARRPRATSSR